MFEINNLTKSYNGEFALKNVSLHINKGLNFIVGASGSGKTTLLKIISGMEQDFEGDVSYCGKDIRALNPYEKGYFYNNVFGFVWQDFNLLEDLTVLENILLPTYLKKESNIKTAQKILKDLKLTEIAGQKAKYLSGGQKQRVAIARELMKNPQVIIADEPTSALDEKTSKEVMGILRTIAKNKTVIVVTHDTSLIEEKDCVYELDKGELIQTPNVTVKKSQSLQMQQTYALTLSSAISILKTDIKRHIGKFLISVLTLMIATLLLLTTFSGVINNSGQSSLNKLIETYGEGFLDISIVNSFISAEGAGGTEDKPQADVSQDISGLYDIYEKDARVDFVLFSQAFNNISITADSKTYKVQSTGSTPVLKKLIAGRTPANDKYEVVVPESLVKQMGLSNESILGKEIEFDSSIYNWDSGSPVLKDANITATVVGVGDNTAYYEYEGKQHSYTVDDAFFFGQTALDDLREQAEITKSEINFIIRAKTPKDFISIKDELNKNGIVPLGQFELVEDIVRLGNQTAEQSGSASVVIGLLAVVMVIAVFTVSTLMKKREYAIYKVSGFANKHLNLIALEEILAQTIMAILLMLITSPLLDVITKAAFGISILSARMLFTGVGLSFGIGLVAYLITSILSVKTNVSYSLKTGDR